MADATQPMQVMQERLREAGCNEALIDDCMAMVQNQRQQELMVCLKKHRSCLLGNLHQCQKEIDALDFLLYHLRKEICMEK